MYKEDLTLNNLQRLIYHETQPNQTQDKLLVAMIVYECFVSWNHITVCKQVTIIM